MNITHIPVSVKQNQKQVNISKLMKKTQNMEIFEREDMQYNYARTFLVLSQLPSENVYKFKYFSSRYKILV